MQLLKIDEEIKKRLNIPEVKQIGLVVRDVEKAIKYYSQIFGIGPFKTFIPEFFNKTYYGKPADFTMKLSFTNWGPIEFELIQPLEGKSIYTNFLENGREGIHHLGFEVEDLDASIEAYKEIDIEVLQGGRVKGGGHAYLDTESIVGFIVEIIHTPPGWPL